MSRTVEQRRAASALAFINRNTKEANKEKLNTHIHKLPSLILQCGLGQALAFLLADAAGRENEPSYLLYLQLQQWLCGEKDQANPMRVFTSHKLIDALLGGSRNEYVRAQEESLLLLNWIKKFADANLVVAEEKS